MNHDEALKQSFYNHLKETYNFDGNSIVCNKDILYDERIYHYYTYPAFHPQILATSSNLLERDRIEVKGRESHEKGVYRYSFPRWGDFITGISFPTGLKPLYFTTNEFKIEFSEYTSISDIFIPIGFYHFSDFVLVCQTNMEVPPDIHVIYTNYKRRWLRDFFKLLSTLTIISKFDKYTLIADKGSVKIEI
jgi:hypothetical protein